MTKKEAIWREILIAAREQENVRTIFTQKEIAADFGVSLSTAHNALKVPREAHAIEVSSKNFRLVSYDKLLSLWASFRKLDKEILARVRIDARAGEIEACMPQFITFGSYSAASLEYGIAPAEYDHVYVYAEAKHAGDIISRAHATLGARAGMSFGKSEYPNLFIIKKDPFFSRYKKMPLEQIYVDIWNSPEWYAKDFLAAIEVILKKTAQL